MSAFTDAPPLLRPGSAAWIHSVVQLLYTAMTGPEHMLPSVYPQGVRTF